MPIYYKLLNQTIKNVELDETVYEISELNY